MRDSFSKARETHLLVDPGAGVILEAPGVASVSRRNVDTHPYIESVVSDGKETIFAGPDAKAAAKGHTSQDNFVRYDVVRDVAGFLEIVRTTA